MKGSLSEILILVILMMAFVIGFAGFYGVMASNPDYGLTGENVSTLTSQQKINDLANTINETSQTFQSVSNTNNTQPTGIAYLFYAPYQFIIGSIQVGLLVFKVPSLIISMETDILSAIPGMGAAQWIVSVVNTIIMIVVLFAIIYFIVGKR